MAAVVDAYDAEGRSVKGVEVSAALEALPTPLELPRVVSTERSGDTLLFALAATRE